MRETGEGDWEGQVHYKITGSETAEGIQSTVIS